MKYIQTCSINNQYVGNIAYVSCDPVTSDIHPYSVEDSRVFAETHRALLNFKMAEADEALIKERVRAWQRRKTQRQQKAVAEVP